MAVRNALWDHLHSYRAPSVEICSDAGTPRSTPTRSTAWDIPCWIFPWNGKTSSHGAAADGDTQGEKSRTVTQNRGARTGVYHGKMLAA
jgi:hypothetical protein